jgi:hypothetical protein
MQKKTVKHNSHMSDVDYIPEPSDDSEEDEQVARSVLVSKKVIRLSKFIYFISYTHVF